MYTWSHLEQVKDAKKLLVVTELFNRVFILTEIVIKGIQCITIR